MSWLQNPYGQPPLQRNPGAPGGPGALAGAIGGPRPSMDPRSLYYGSYGNTTPQQHMMAGTSPYGGQMMPGPGGPGMKPPSGVGTQPMPGSSPAGDVAPDSRMAYGRMKTEAHHEMPGSQNGNPADGERSAEYGVGPGWKSMMAQPTAAPGTPSAPQQRGGTHTLDTPQAPGTRYLAPPPAQPQATQPIQALSGTAEGPAKAQGEIAPASQPTGTPAPAAAPYTWTGTNNTTYNLTAPLPKNWGTMDWAQKKAWISGHTWTPAAQGSGPGTSSDNKGQTGSNGQPLDQGTGGTADKTQGRDVIPRDDWFSSDGAIGQIQDPNSNVAWWKNSWVPIFGTSRDEALQMGELPDPTAVTPAGLTFKVGSGGNYLEMLASPLATQTKGVASLLGKANNLYDQLIAQGWTPGSAPNFDEPKVRDLFRKYQAATAMLGHYGYAVDDGGFADPGAGAGSGQTGSGGRTPGDDYSIGTQLNDQSYYDALKNVAGSWSDPIKRLLLGQAMDERFQWQNAQQDRQQSLNIAKNYADKVMSDPAFAKFYQGAQDYAAQPILSDWGGIRAREISASDKAVQDAQGALAKYGARRGISTASQMDTGQRLRLGESARMAGRLGELSQAQTDEQRQQRMAGLGLLQTAGQMGTGIRSTAEQQAMQILMGQAPITKAPGEGLGNAGLSLFGTQMAKDAADRAGGGGSSFSDAFSGVMNVLGGTGGQAMLGSLFAPAAGGAAAGAAGGAVGAAGAAGAGGLAGGALASGAMSPEVLAALALL